MDRAGQRSPRRGCDQAHQRVTAAQPLMNLFRIGVCSLYAKETNKVLRTLPYRRRGAHPKDMTATQKGSITTRSPRTGFNEAERLTALWDDPTTKPAEPWVCLFPSPFKGKGQISHAIDESKWLAGPFVFNSKFSKDSKPEEVLRAILFNQYLQRVQKLKPRPPTADPYLTEFDVQKKELQMNRERCYCNLQIYANECVVIYRWLDGPIKFTSKPNPPKDRPKRRLLKPRTPRVPPLRLSAGSFMRSSTNSSAPKTTRC